MEIGEDGRSEQTLGGGLEVDNRGQGLEDSDNQGGTDEGADRDDTL